MVKKRGGAKLGTGRANEDKPPARSPTNTVRGPHSGTDGAVRQGSKFRLRGPQFRPVWAFHSGVPSCPGQPPGCFQRGSAHLAVTLFFNNQKASFLVCPIFPWTTPRLFPERVCPPKSYAVFSIRRLQC